MANNNFYDRLDKVWTIEFEDGTVLTNDDIYMDGGIKITHNLCDEDQLMFGQCISDTAEITLINKGVSYIGKRFNVTVGVTNPNYSLNIGEYKVVSETVSNNKESRKLVAFDRFDEIFNMNVADWYNSLTFPITIKNMRLSFFEHFNIPNSAATQSLLFDSTRVQKQIDPSEMTGKKFLTSLCEMNGVFGRFRQGLFQFRSLSTDFDSAFTIPQSRIVTENHEDFVAQKIDKLQIRQDEYDIGAVVGTGDNAYIIQDNFFFYGWDAASLESLATRLLARIGAYEYTPIKMTCVGNPSLAIGDPINVQTADGSIIKSYVLKKTIKGPQALKDEIVCKGVFKREEKANGVNEDIIQMRGKYNKLVRNVDGLTSEVFDSATGMSRITQNAQAILAKVSAVGGNGASFGWNLTASGFVLTSNGNQVFKCDSGGITVNGYATVGSVSAVSGEISQLRTDVFSAGFITANYITAEVIQSKFQSKDAGIITIGTVRAGTLQIWDGAGNAYATLRLDPTGNVKWK